MGVGIALSFSQILWLSNVFSSRHFVLFHFLSSTTAKDLNLDALVSWGKYFFDFAKKKIILKGVLFHSGRVGVEGVFLGKHCFPFLLSEFTPWYFQQRHIFLFFYSNCFALIFYSKGAFERCKTNEDIHFSSSFHLKFCIFVFVFFFQNFSDRLQVQLTFLAASEEKAGSWSNHLVRIIWK